ncbi:hypothetical protein Pan161_11300 [Gimesia algae]|uniref:Uncharacterized protein n=1 Tax=Gimesia algae TaxID=2527971 RepID=A0A517V918_9PLAN|nr:hypothetical protein Pan161_11300 [Gimesia algae]
MTLSVCSELTKKKQKQFRHHILILVCESSLYSTEAKRRVVCQSGIDSGSISGKHANERAVYFGQRAIPDLIRN